MISYANAKINIGLNITSKRADGYHTLETLFYPYPLYDIIELYAKESAETTMEITGMDLPLGDDNLCLRAYRLLASQHALPAVHIHLHKQIPFGAGLGGGSSDAAFILKMLNQYFALNLEEPTLQGLAAKLGADCPFFIKNQAMYATGIGTDLLPIDLDLSDRYIVLVKPQVHVSTVEAYQQVKPMSSEHDLREIVKLPLQDWKFYIKNDFEDSLFERYPLIREAKLALYEKGALYASMSGSGSAVYGIFAEPVDLSSLEHIGKVYYPAPL